MYYKDIYFKYTKELSSEQYSPLSIEEERNEFKLYKEGSQCSYEKIIKSHLRFVIFIVQQFHIPDNMDIMDVIQVGVEGLIKGIQKFDINYNCRISTYCAYWIKFYIRELLKEYNEQKSLEELDDVIENIPAEDKTVMPQVSQDIIDIVFKPLSQQERLIMTYVYGLDHTGKTRTLMDISSVLGVTLERVRQLKESAKKKIDKEKFMDLVL